MTLRSKLNPLPPFTPADCASILAGVEAKPEPCLDCNCDPCICDEWVREDYGELPDEEDRELDARSLTDFEERTRGAL